MNKLVRFVTRGKVVVLGLNYYSDNEYTIKLIICTYRSGMFYIDKSYNNIPNLQSLNKYITKSVPLIVHISGIVTINRHIPISGDYSLVDDQAINHALPGTDLAKLIWTEVKTMNSGTFISFARKEKLLEPLQTLQIEFFVTAYTVGPFIGGFLFFNQETEENDIFKIQSDNITLLIKKTQLVAFEEIHEDTHNEPFNWKGYNLEPLDIPLIGAAIICFSGFESFPVSYKDVEEINIQKEEFVYYSKYSRILKYVLVGLLFLLTVNTFLYMKYRKDGEIAGRDLIQYQGILQNLKAYEDDIRNKEKIIRDFGIGSIGNYALLSDKSALALPKNGIRLKSLDICPVNEKKTGQDWSITPEIILIKGEVDNSDILDSYIESLKSAGWTKDVLLKYYRFSIDQQNALFGLEIRIAKPTGYEF